MAKNDSSSYKINSSNETCNLDAYIQSVDKTSRNVTIRLRNGLTYHLSTIFNFTNHMYFELTGCSGDECTPGAVIQCTGQEGGLFFERIHGTVKIKGVHFEDCQLPIQNFSSTCPATDMMDDHAALYVGYSGEVSIDYVTVSKSKGAGLVFNSVEQAHVTNSVFSYAKHGIQVFMPQNVDTNLPEATVNHSHNKVSQYSFNSCRFINNSALPTRTGNDSTKRNMFYRGGGLSLYWMGNTSHVVVNITHCKFSDNKAVYGGGLSAYFQGKATNNTLYTSNTTFSRNEGAPYDRKTRRIESGGGGAQVMLAAYPYDQAWLMNNSIIFKHCKFIGNSAYWGGGLSIVSAHADSYSAHEVANNFLLESCEWKRNRARLGSAVDCIPWDRLGSGTLPVVIIADSTTENNTIFYNDADMVKIGGAGTIYTDLITLSLEGKNSFGYNTGSGISAVNAVVRFKTDSYTMFVKNHGLYGGGLALYGNAKMVLYSGTHIVFDTNRAKLEGGAIFHNICSPRNLITAQNCFIQYENTTTHPKDWNVTIHFNCNYAEMNGHSVLGSSLLPCIWTGAPYGHGSDVDINTNLKEVFRWNNTFVFSDNCSSSEDAPHNTDGSEISTGPAVANESTLETIKAYPGQLLQLSGNVTDEFNTSICTVFRGVSDNHSEGDLHIGGQYVSNLIMQFEGREGASFNLKLYSPWSLTFILRSKVKLLQCPPGFAYNTDSKMCKCSQKQMWAITGCSSKPGEAHALLRSGYWAGYIKPPKDATSSQHGQFHVCEEEMANNQNSSCIFVTGSCRKGSCSKLYSGALRDSKPLPTRASNKDITRVVCSPQHSEGILCSQCKAGYGYNIIGYGLECVRCIENPSNQDYAKVWAQWAASRFLPLVIMVSVFLLFDIDILTGSMQSFIFYSQMIAFLSPLLDKAIKLHKTKEAAEVSFMMYDIWQLKYFEFILQRVTNNLGPSTCIAWPRLTIISLEYLPAIFPFIFIYTIWLLKSVQHRGYICCCWPCKTLLQKASAVIHRLRRKWSPNSTIIHGLTAFMALSYTKFLITSMQLLTPSYLEVDLKFRYIAVHSDSYLPYASGQHLPYMICAMLVLFTFVAIPPLILILVPLVPRAAVHLQPERSNRAIWLCDKMFAGPKWQLFLDAFQGGFKPKFSFFAGLFFLYRIVIIATYSFRTRLEYQYILQILLIVIVLVIHSNCQPYKRKIHNVIDTLIYGNMLIIVLLGVCLWYKSSHEGQQSKEVVMFAIFIMNIPQISFFVYLIYKAIKGIRKGVLVWRLRRRTNSAPQGEENSEERDLELLTNSFHYRIDYAALDDDFASEMALID